MSVMRGQGIARHCLVTRVTWYMRVNTLPGASVGMHRGGRDLNLRPVEHRSTILASSH